MTVTFSDRRVALERLERIAEEGTYPVYTLYGPEGCGKTALLKQAILVLEEHGYQVVYVNPTAGSISEALYYTPGLGEIVRAAVHAVPEPYSSLVELMLEAASLALRRLRRPRLAVLADDVFQAIGFDKAELLVKRLLNLIEYPPGDYERIVVLVASSEGVARERLGRHRWTAIYSIWNLPREGFAELYSQVPGEKPSFEHVWALTGGNPALLARLYALDWRVDELLESIVEEKGLEELVSRLDSRMLEVLWDAIRDPDILFHRGGEESVSRLRRLLIEYNLVSRVPMRSPHLWFDTPPPGRDEALGIGERYAWQTPIHREAVRWALERVKGG